MSTDPSVSERRDRGKQQEQSAALSEFAVPRDGLKKVLEHSLELKAKQDLKGIRPVKLSITHNLRSECGAQRDISEAR
jgi:hypothetical protein